jgi:tRNA dimethylallyltransferase
VLERDPEEGISAGEFGRRAREAAEAVRGLGKRPLLVGGSGLYLQAVLGGIDRDLPRNDELRNHLKKRLEEKGTQTLHEELRRRDPEAAARISPRDGQRIVRALEILALTGTGPGARRRPGERGRQPARIAILDREREDLLERIRARVDEMIEAGLEDEVARLLARGLTPDLPVLRSVGYAETIALRNGAFDRAAWRERIVINTRRLAKRQRTWFRSLPGAEWFSIPRDEDPAETAARVDAAWRGEGSAA